MISPHKLDDAEIEKALIFEDDHYGCTISYTFTPTGVGQVVIVSCQECEVKEDISDYDSW